MTKKKPLISAADVERATADAVEAAAAEPPEPERDPVEVLAEAGVDPKAAYTVGKWHHHDNYLCTRCGYASIHREATLKHFATRHAVRSPAPRIVHTGLVTEDGQDIVRVEEPAKEE